MNNNTEEHNEYQVINETNQEKFLTFLKEADPELFNLKQRSLETGVDLTILWFVLDAIDSIATSTRYGTISIIIEDGIVRFVRGEHAQKLNLPIVKQTQ